MEKDISYQPKPKESWGSYTYIRQNRLKNKVYYKRQRRTLHNDQGSIQEEDKTIVNIYAPHTGAPQYIRQMLIAIKEEIDSNTMIVEEFNTPLSPMDRSSKMKINKETSFK